MSIRPWWLVVVPWLVTRHPRARRGAAAGGRSRSPSLSVTSGRRHSSADPGRRRSPSIDRRSRRRTGSAPSGCWRPTIERQPEARELLLTIASRLHAGQEAAQRGHRAEEGGEARCRSTTTAACSWRWPTSRWGAATGRGRSWRRSPRAEPGNVIHPYWLARLDYDAGRYASAVRAAEAGRRPRADVRPRARQPRACATRPSISPTRRSCTTGRPCD